MEINTCQIRFIGNDIHGKGLDGPDYRFIDGVLILVDVVRVDKSLLG